MSAFELPDRFDGTPGEAPSVVENGFDLGTPAERFTGSMTFEGRDDHFILSYDLVATADCAELLVGAFELDPAMGYLLLPGEELPIDLADQRLAARSIACGANGVLKWGFNSQLGVVVEDKGAGNGRELHLRRNGSRWTIGTHYINLKNGDRITGTQIVRPIPFFGAVRLAQAIETAPSSKSIEETTAGEGINFKSIGPRAISARIEDVPVSLNVGVVGATNEHRISLSGKATPVRFGDENFWRIDCRFQNLEEAPCRVRFDAEIQTPCANPSWDGDATVFIPGNFARTNYDPHHLHGGGPKYGPSPVPEREELTANDDAPGRCHGWTFASSRLPQVWAAAADRKARTLIWVGAEPASEIGENCAGFVSPAGGVTALRLSTPTTYEPWVPLGYSRMRPEARRDSINIDGHASVEWSFFLARRATDDLNGWAALDRALYLRNRPMQSTLIKLTVDDAIRACASALYERFYQEQRGVLVYSTGPQGQNANVGFTGMAHSALALMWAGEEFGIHNWSRAGVRVMNTVAEMFLAGPEFPWTAVPAGKIAGEAGSFVHGSGEPGYVVMAAFDSLAEALKREEAMGHARPRWREALRRCADAWVAHQSPEGAYPHWGPGFAPDFPEDEFGCTNVEAGVIANMVDAHELFGGMNYLNSARKAAAFYGKQLDDGKLWGGPGDIRALVNSEVPMFFLRGFRRLFEVTKDDEHKRLMLAAAAWRYSFQFAHSWYCDPGSPLFKQGWAGLGSENASACNLHSVAFGCINIPDMWALWRITGDEYHRMRCADVAQYSTQQYARFAGDLGFPFAGAGTESWWTSDTLWGKGHPWIFTDPGFDLGYMSWVTGWSAYGALHARKLGVAH